MDKKTGYFLITMVFVIGLAFAIIFSTIGNAQTETEKCPDKCTNSTLYQKGILDNKKKICVYDIEKKCDYGCRDNKSFTIPECNSLPTDTQTSLEILYEKIKEMTTDTGGLEDISSVVNKIFSKPTIISGGTEYSPNENGTLSARLLDGNSNPINLATCNVTVYYPNQSTTSLFIDNKEMKFLEKGNYYYNFKLDEETGVYITNLNCIFPSTIFFQNISYGGKNIPAGEPEVMTFPFDDSDNMTINNASVSIASRGARYNLYMSGSIVIANGGSTTTSQIVNTTKLYQGNFTIAENQPFTIDCIQGCPLNLDWISLNVNYTSQDPTQILRGQEEIHVSALTNLYRTLQGISTNITSVNDTTKIGFQNMNINMANNFTNTNSMIASVNGTINNVLNNITSQIGWWGNELNTTVTNWGNNIISTINYWGNQLESKIDGIIMGNVTVTALVDYDEIALTVVSYFKSLGLKFFEE